MIIAIQSNYIEVEEQTLTPNLGVMNNYCERNREFNVDFCNECIKNKKYVGVNLYKKSLIIKQLKAKNP